MSLVARDAARISALENSVVDTGGAPSSAGGAVIATNQLLSKSNAYIQDSLVVTTGTGSDVSLDADNVSQIDASTLSVVKVSRTGNAVSPVLAFNSMGWDDPIIFTKALSVLLGNDVEVGEEPVEVQAYIKNSKVTATGDLSVTADSEERVFELTTLTSEQLDDLGNQAKDDEASKDKNEAAEDKTADAQLLSNLRDAFKTQDIELSASLDKLKFKTIVEGKQWELVDDQSCGLYEKGNGRLFTITTDGDLLRVSRTSLLHATVGSTASSNAKNDRALLDGYVASVKKTGRGLVPREHLKNLKHGANGMAAGGVLATNRVRTQAKAYIENDSAKRAGIPITVGWYRRCRLG